MMDQATSLHAMYSYPAPEPEYVEQDGASSISVTLANDEDARASGYSPKADIRYQSVPSHDPNTTSDAGNHHPKPLLSTLQSTDEVPLLLVDAGNHHPEPLLSTPQSTDDVRHLLVYAQSLSQQFAPFEMLLPVQPPIATGPGRELYPPFVVQVLNPAMDLQNVSALAAMYENGRDVTNELLHGSKVGIYSKDEFSKEEFSFFGLSISKPGHYNIKISLYYRGVVINCVETDQISVGDRPLLRAVRETQTDRRQLLWQIVNASFQDDNTGLFPRWKTHTGSSIITLGKIDFKKVMVFVPVSDFVREKLDDGFYRVWDGLGDGLFCTDDGTWGDDGEVELVYSQTLTIRATDGLMYRRQAGFGGLYVALERRVAVVGDSFCIAHMVLLPV